LRELELITLTPQIRAERNIASRRVALIYRVSDRVASDLGIQAGDVILQINRTPIESADEAARAIDAYAGRGLIRMYYERAGRPYFTDFIIR
jgi:serine protease Do